MNSKIIRDCFNKKDLYNIFLLEEELDCIDSLNKDVDVLKLKNEEYKNNLSILKESFFDKFRSLNRENYSKILDLKSNKCSKYGVFKNRELYQSVVDENEKNIRTYEVLQEYTYRKIIEIEEKRLNEFLLANKRKIS